MTSSRVPAVPLVLTTVILGLLPPVAVRAHGVSPARLELREIETGTFEVTFALPIIEGRKLRAEPLLPEVCEEVGARVTQSTGTSFVQTWTVRCEPPSLAGHAIAIVGLLGTQTSLMLKVETLDGRLHTAVLKPGRPFFVVPEPPSVLGMSIRALVAGLRGTLRRPELWVLLLLVGTMIPRPRLLAAGVLAYAAAHALGQWLAGRSWLLISPHLPAFLAALTAMVPALDIAQGRAQVRDWVRPVWLLLFLLGLLYGGAHPGTVDPEGLSRREQGLAAVVFAFGTGSGLFLLVFIAAQVRNLLAAVRPGVSVDRARWVGYLAGTVAWALILLRAAVLAFAPGVLPAVVGELLLLTAVVGIWLSGTFEGRRNLWLATFAALYALGIAAGLGGVSLPYATAIVRGSLFLFGLTLVLRKALPVVWGLAVGVAAVVSQAWQTGYTMAIDVSLPMASAVGAAVLALAVAHVSLRGTARAGVSSLPIGERMIGAAAAILAVTWRIGEYRAWFDGHVATEASLGMLEIPLASLVLASVAVMLWPRRRRALRELGVQTQRPVAHWVFLALAFFALPVGTWAAPNPFFAPHAPAGDDAKRLVGRMLTNTYDAFNVADEDALYDRLAESVSGELIADLYLDGRRRLTAGTREGAHVTVRDVSVLEIDDAAQTRNGGDSFAYRCKWVVTARVEHMQHIHHRQNIYNGILTIRIDDDRWKIAGVELMSEDRVVLPWTPG